MTIDTTKALSAQLQTVQIGSDTEPPQTEVSTSQNFLRLRELGIVDDSMYVLPGFGFSYIATEELKENLSAFIRTDNTHEILKVLSKSLGKRSSALVLCGEGFERLAGWNFLSNRFLELLHQRDESLTLEAVLSQEVLEEAKAACAKQPSRLTFRFIIRERVNIQSLYNLLVIKNLLTPQNSCLHQNMQGFRYQNVDFCFVTEDKAPCRTSGEGLQIMLTEGHLDGKDTPYFVDVGVANQWCLDAMLRLSHFYYDDEESDLVVLANLQNGYETIITPDRLTDYRAFRESPTVEGTLHLCHAYAYRGGAHAIRALAKDLEVDPTKSLWHACVALLAHVSFHELEALMQVFGAIGCRFESQNGLHITCTDAIGIPFLVFRDANCTFKVPFDFAKALDTVAAIGDLSCTRHLQRALLGGLIDKRRCSPTLDKYLVEKPSAHYDVQLALAALFGRTFSHVLVPFASEHHILGMQVAFMANGLSLSVDPSNLVESWIDCLLKTNHRACLTAGQVLLLKLEGHSALKARWLLHLDQICVRLAEQLDKDPYATQEQRDCWITNHNTRASSLIRQSSLNAILSPQANASLTADLTGYIRTLFRARKILSQEENVKVWSRILHNLQWLQAVELLDVFRNVSFFKELFPRSYPSHVLELLRTLLRMIRLFPAAREELLVIACNISGSEFYEKVANELTTFCKNEQSVQVLEALWPTIQAQVRSHQTNNMTYRFVKALLERAGIQVLIQIYKQFFPKNCPVNNVEISEFSDAVVRLGTLADNSHCTEVLDILCTIFTSFPAQFQDIAKRTRDFSDISMRLMLRQIQLHGSSDDTIRQFNTVREWLMPGSGSFLCSTNNRLFYNSDPSVVVSVYPRSPYHGPVLNRWMRMCIGRIEECQGHVQEVGRLLDFAIQNIRNLTAHGMLDKDLINLLRNAIDDEPPLHINKTQDLAPLGAIRQALTKVTAENAVEVLTKQQTALLVWQEESCVDAYEARDEVLAEVYAVWKAHPAVCLDREVSRSLSNVLTPNTVWFGPLPMRSCATYLNTLSIICSNSTSDHITFRCLMAKIAALLFAARSKFHLGEEKNLFVKEVVDHLSALKAANPIHATILKTYIDDLIEIVLVDIPERPILVAELLEVVGTHMLKDANVCMKVASATITAFMQDTNPGKINTLIALCSTCQAGLSPHLWRKCFTAITSALKPNMLLPAAKIFITCFIEPKHITADDIHATIPKEREFAALKSTLLAAIPK